jgi:hypothetical protein
MKSDFNIIARRAHEFRRRAVADIRATITQASRPPGVE